MQYRKSVILYLMCFTMTAGVLLFNTCSEETITKPPPRAEPEINLSLAEEPALTEIFLKLEMKNVEFPQQYLVTRNGALVLNDTLNSNDTTIIDTGLAPSTNYTYRAFRLVDGQKADSSALFEARTMDTTSHDFNWEILTFGTGSSSVLRDAAIIEPNDIWVAGEIYVVDSTGWEIQYNALHWDGQKWELKRIKTNACGGVDYPPIETVFAFSANEVLFAHIDGSITHFDGNSFSNDCSLITQLNGSAKKMWGISKNDLYVVSGNGFIAHYDGIDWQRIESGTNLPIQDIWGSETGLDNNLTIMGVASEKYYLSDKKIIQIDPNSHQVSIIDWPFQNRRIHSIWFNKYVDIWVCGAGVFLNQDNHWKEFSELPLIFTNRVRGPNINDIFVVGDFGIVAHYNGSSWRVYNEGNVALYESVDFKDNLIVAVGSSGGKAYVLKMVR
jgi:hypothetical protein